MFARAVPRHSNRHANSGSSNVSSSAAAKAWVCRGATTSGGALGEAPRPWPWRIAAAPSGWPRPPLVPYRQWVADDLQRGREALRSDALGRESHPGAATGAFRVELDVSPGVWDGVDRDSVSAEREAQLNADVRQHAYISVSSLDSARKELLFAAGLIAEALGASVYDPSPKTGSRSAVTFSRSCARTLARISLSVRRRPVEGIRSQNDRAPRRRALARPHLTRPRRSSRSGGGSRAHAGGPDVRRPARVS